MYYNLRSVRDSGQSALRDTLSFAAFSRPVNLPSDCISPHFKVWRPRELSDRPRGPEASILPCMGQLAWEPAEAVWLAPFPLRGDKRAALQRSWAPSWPSSPATACAFPAGERTPNDRAKGEVPGTAARSHGIQNPPWPQPKIIPCISISQQSASSRRGAHTTYRGQATANKRGRFSSAHHLLAGHRLR